MQNHLNLVLVFPVALVAYLVIRRIEGSIGWLPVLVWTSVSMLGLFSISTELFATTLVFGTIAFVILLIAASEDQERVARAGGLTVARGDSRRARARPVPCSLRSGTHPAPRPTRR